MDIQELKRRAGIVEASAVTGITGRGTDPLAQLDTQTFLKIITTTLDELGQLRPQTMSDMQRIQLARRVVQRFKSPDAAQEQDPAQAQQPQRTPQTAKAAGDPLA